MPCLAQLIGDPGTIAFVRASDAGVDGFVIARLVPAPGVYAPGGPSCTVDDFCVRDPADWPRAGRLLLEAAAAEGRARGAAQTVVVCGHRDEPKRTMLRVLGFSVASEWWVPVL